MKRSLVAFLLLACTCFIPVFATAGPIKAYVAEFAITPPETGGLKTTLQTLLSSRMASEAILPVAAASEAEVLITGSYTQIGKMFSLDAVAKLSSGRTLSTVFEQGESLDDLIPALGKIAARLKTEILQRYPQAGAAAAASQPSASAAQALPGSLPGGSLWLSQRIKGAQMGVAPALSRSEGREVFLAESHALRVYLQEKTLKLLAEIQFPLKEKIVSVDSVGADKDGNPRVFVTIMDGESPASKIFIYQNKQLKLVAGKLPYLFRAIAFNGGEAKVYAQEMGTTEDYYGDLYEVSLAGTTVEKKNPIKLPRYANIFNYNRVTGPDGKSYATVLSTDGYLVVYSLEGEEIWRSSEKFGGSETFFLRDNSANVKDTFEKTRWRFIDQRITVTKDGQVIVPQNYGFFVVGNNRSYSKYSLVSFTWTGSSMEERWRTKQSQNYLADYFFDQETREFVLLEVVQKEGLFGSGGSTVRVIRAD
jgi:hypothetical protein